MERLPKKCDARYLLWGCAFVGLALVPASEPAAIVNGVTVEKTATTSFTRTINWSISKTVIPSQWDLFTGDTGTSQYSVDVQRTGYTDSDWAVTGVIFIYNPGPSAATIETLSDVVSGGISPTVNCGVTLPYNLPADSSLTCTYETSLPDGNSRTNTVTVTTSEGTSATGSAPVEFGAPTTEVNATVNVQDTNGGSFTFSDSGVVSYSSTFACNGDQGVHSNTTTIVETGQSDSATVDVQCYSLQVTKDAYASLTRTWNWAIGKSADQTDLVLSPGQQSLVNYTVSLSATPSDSEWAVHGSIIVHNPNPARAATLNSVADLAGAVAGAVDCGVAFPHALAAASTLQCSYNASLPDASGSTNTGTATLQNFSYDPGGAATPSGTTDFSGSAAIDFAGAAVSKVDHCVDVGDSFAGALGTVCENQQPITFTYSRYVGPYSQCGAQQVENTASFQTDNTGTTGSDAWTVAVDVPCVRDHYACYQAKTDEFVPREVTLADQFGTLTATANKLKNLCAPADKNGEGIVDATAHLTCYDLKDAPDLEPRLAEVQNQFGSLILGIEKTKRLCLPAKKDGVASDLASRDHYLCYQATAQTPFGPVAVTLEDQFMSGAAILEKPVELCNPVDKAGDGLDLVDPDNHLTCYQLNKQSKLEKRQVTTEDQFGVLNDVDVVKAETLCVPSTMVELP